MRDRALVFPSLKPTSLPLRHTGKKALGVHTGELHVLDEMPVGCEARHGGGCQGGGSICERFCLYVGQPLAVGLYVCKPDEDHFLAV